MIDFRDDWELLGLNLRKPRKVSEQTSSYLSLVRHLESGLYDWLTVVGPSPQKRAALYNELVDDGWNLHHTRSRAWLAQPVRDVVLDFIRNLEINPDLNSPYQGKEWGWLYEFVRQETIYLDGPLRSMAAREVSMAYDATLMFFEWRFRIREGWEQDKIDEARETFLMWLADRPLSPEQEREVGFIQRHPGGVRYAHDTYNVLSFMLSWAHQNGVLNTHYMVLDDLESACGAKDRDKLRDLVGLLRKLSLWYGHVPFPLRVVVGFDSTKMSLLKELNPTFAKDISRRIVGPSE